MCSMTAHSKQSAELHHCSSLVLKFTGQVLSFRVNLSSSLPCHLKLSLMVDDVSMCSMRAHLKWSVELGHCSSLPSPFELSVLVDDVSMCSVRVHSKWLLKFTPQVTSITLKFTARVTFKFTARVTFKFTTSVTFKFTARVTFKFTTSVTFKFTAIVTFKFTPHLKLSLMTDQVLVDICLQ